MVIYRALCAFLTTFALMFSTIPALAATESISATSSYASGSCLADTVRFDPSGRLWVGNLQVSSPDCPENQLHVWKKSLGTWSEDERVDIGHYGFSTLDFGTDGTLYGDTSKSGQIRAVFFNDDGTVKRSKIYKLKKKRSVVLLATASNNRLYVMSTGRVEEYRLPLKKAASKNKPIRTLNGDWGAWNEFPQLAAGPDGTVYIVKNINNMGNPVLVFSPSQSGAATPSRSIVIDSALSSNGNVSDLSVTPSGDLAVLYFEWSSDGGVAIYSNTSNGSAVVPVTWYPLSGRRESLDFDSSGAFATVLQTSNPSDVNVSNYRESFCIPHPGDRC